MAVNNNAIGSFSAIFLPPADIIAIGDPVRDYFNKPDGKAAAFVNALSATAGPDTIQNAQQAFMAKSEQVYVDSRPAADQWVDNAFSALATRLPGILPVANQYTNDTLYIVTTPEFGLNAWTDSPGLNGIKNWDATGAFPSRNWKCECARVILETI
jgi:hypothetical protein